MINMNDLTAKLKLIQKEIELYQKNCKHNVKHIKFNPENQPQWLCQRCIKFLRVPTQDEVEIWLKK